MKALGRGSVASIVKVGLEVTWVVLWIAAAGVGLGAVGYLGLLTAISAGAVDESVLHLGDSTRQIGPIRIETDAGDRLIWPVVATALLAAAVAVAGAMAIVWRLRKLFASFIGGEPFSAENARHLRVIWMVMLAMEVSRYVIMGGVMLLVFAFGEPNGASFGVRAPVNVATWGAILILIVLAEIFREGARLREEEKLTI